MNSEAQLKKNLRVLLDKIDAVSEALKSTKNINTITVLLKEQSELLQQLSTLFSSLEIDAVEFSNDVDLYIRLYNTLKKMKKSRKLKVDEEKFKKLAKLVEDMQIDYTCTIKEYIKSSDSGIEYLSEGEFDIDELANEVVEDIDVKKTYNCYVSEKSGTVYLEPLSNDYTEMIKINYDVLIDNVFRMYPTVTTVKFRLQEDFPVITLSEIKNRPPLYMDRPVRVRASIISVDTETKTQIFRAHVKVNNDDYYIMYNFPPKPLFLSKEGRKLKIIEDEDTIRLGFKSFLVADDTTTINAITYSFEKIEDFIGEEVILEGIIYPVRLGDRTEEEVVFLVTDIREADSDQANLSEQDIQEVQRILKEKKGLELVDWMIDNYAPEQIRYSRKGDFVWRMKLIHLILALNSWYDNKQMIHALLMSKPAQGKSTLANYLQLISKKTIKTDKPSLTQAGLIGGLEPKTKEYQVGLLKRADRGILVIDEADKHNDKSAELWESIQSAMQSGEVFYSKVTKVQYKTKFNLLLLSNYDDERLTKMLEYVSDAEEELEKKKEFIYSELYRILTNSAVISRFTLIDTDIFEEKTEEEELDELIGIITDENISTEQTIEEIKKAGLIRKILIYLSKTNDLEKINRTITKNIEYIKEILRRANFDKRKAKNFKYLILLLTVLQNKDEVDTETIELAYNLMNTTETYEKLFTERTEKYAEFVEKFISELVSTTDFTGIKKETVLRNFKEKALQQFSADELDELIILFEQRLNTVIHKDKLLQEFNGTVRAGQGLVEKVLREVLEEIDLIEVDRRSNIHYLDIRELSEKFRVSQNFIRQLFTLVFKEKASVTTIVVKNEKRKVIALEMSDNELYDMLSDDRLKQQVLDIFI